MRGAVVDEHAARQVLAAVLLQAVRDAQEDDPVVAARARRWLWEEGAAWAEMIDIDGEAVRDWLRRLPALPHEEFLLELV